MYYYEFPKLVFMGKLDFPTSRGSWFVIALAQSLKISRRQIMHYSPSVKCFDKIYMFASYEISNHVSVLQKLVLYFSKAFTAKESKNQHIKIFISFATASRCERRTFSLSAICLDRLRYNHCIMHILFLLQCF